MSICGIKNRSAIFACLCKPNAPEKKTAMHGATENWITVKTVKGRADINGDGEITPMDATAIQYYLADMKTPFKIGEPIK